MLDVVDLPKDHWEERPEDTQEGKGLTVRTMNSNLGAIRVDVRRDLGRVRRSILELAAMVGEGWEYALPFKKKDKRTGNESTELVRGPSIRCTTAVARAYGNCDVNCEAINETAGAYQLVATFLDIETGFRLTRPFRQRKDQNVGGMGGDRGRVEDVIFQIGASKATRNVIRNALPDFTEFAIEQARDNLAAKIEKNKPAVVAKILQRLEEFGIPVAAVELFYQVKLTNGGVDKISPKVLAQIVRILQAVADSLIKPGEAFAQENAPKDGGPLREVDEPSDDKAEQAQRPAPAEPEQAGPAEPQRAAPTAEPQAADASAEDPATAMELNDPQPVDAAVDTVQPGDQGHEPVTTITAQEPQQQGQTERAHQPSPGPDPKEKARTRRGAPRKDMFDE